MVDVIGWFVLFLLLGGIYIAVEAHYYQGVIKSELEKELGFRDSSTYCRNGRRLESIVSIRGVNENGIMHQAGFREGDVLPKESHTSLFKKLHRRRGQEVELVVADGGEGSSFYDRPRRTIRLRVPTRSM